MTFDSQIPGYFKPMLAFESFTIDFSQYDKFKIKTSNYILNLGVKMVLPMLIKIAQRKLQIMLSTIISFAVNDAIYFALPELVEVTKTAWLFIRFISKLTTGGNNHKWIELQLNEPFKIFNIKSFGELKSQEVSQISAYKKIY